MNWAHESSGMQASERPDIHYKEPEKPEEWQSRVDAAFDALFSEVVIHSADSEGGGDR